MKIVDSPLRANRQLRRDWQRFLSSGCRLAAFSSRLAEHLAGHCDFSRPFYPSPEAFWRAIFGDDTFLLWRFLNKFGGNHHSIFAQDRRWLEDGETAEINRALCAERRDLYRPLLEAVCRYECLAQQAYGDQFYQGIQVREVLHTMMAEAVHRTRAQSVRHPTLFEWQSAVSPVEQTAHLEQHDTSRSDSTQRPNQRPKVGRRASHDNPQRSSRFTSG